MSQQLVTMTIAEIISMVVIDGVYNNSERKTSWIGSLSCISAGFENFSGLFIDLSGIREI